MSISSQEAEISQRFFQAIEILKAQGKVKSLRKITIMYNLNYGNIHTIMKKPESFRLRIDVIANLCRDFGISCEWMLLGTEPMFKRQRTSKS